MTFETASAQANATHGISVFLYLIGAAARLLKVCTPGIEEAGTGWIPAVLEVDDILSEAAPGIEVLPQEVTFSVANFVLDAWGTVDYLSQHLRDTHALGNSVTLSAWYKEGTTWSERILFKGLVTEFEIEIDRVVFRCADYSRDLVEIPTLVVDSGAMQFGDYEGELVEDSVGSAVPIAFGKFSAKALKVWPTGHPFADDKLSCILPPMLGLKIPAVPLIPVADRYLKRVGSTVSYTMRHAMFAFGDKTVSAGGSPQIRLQSPGYALRYPTSASDSDLSSATYKIMYSNLYTWNSTLDRALPFLDDESTYLSSTERLMNGAGEYDAMGFGAATGSSYPLSKAQFFYLNRTNPNFTSSTDWWPGVLQMIAVPMRGQSELGGTDEAGGSWFTTPAIYRPQAAINTDFEKASELLTGDRLALACRSEMPPLGDVYEVRCCVLFGDGTTCDRARLTVRETPQQATYQTFPPNYAEINMSDLATAAADVDSATDKFCSMRCYHRQTDNTGELFVPSVEWHKGKFSSNSPDVGTGQSREWIWEVMVKNLHTSGPSLCYVMGVWIEVAYRARIEGSDVLGRFGSDAPAVFHFRSRYQRHMGYGEDRTSPFANRRGGLGAEAPHGIPDSSPTKPLRGFRVFASALAACIDNTPAKFTGTAGSIVENPADIASVLIEKYVGEFALVATGTNFGSFARARNILNGKAGGGDYIWDLSAVIADRMTLRAALDELQRQAMMVVCRQITDAGAVQWRCFVDGPAPQTDAPERLFRTDGRYFTWDDIDRTDGSPRIRPTPLDGLATSVVLNYGWHEPTNKLARSMHVSMTSNSLISEGSTYQAAMAATYAKYFITRQLVINAPWVWNERIANQLVKWHANLARERRLTIEFYLKPAYLDLQAGHIIRFSDDLGTGVDGPAFKYPGPEGATTWSTHNWVVVSTTVVCDPDLRVRVVAREVYTAAA